MKYRLDDKFINAFGNLKLSRKIQLSLVLIIIPLVIVFSLLFFSMHSYNQQYDRIIANSSEAGRFSIKFKEEFDYKIYLIIAGHSSFSEENPYEDIDAARDIASDLINNTNLEDNKNRAQSIMNMLDNLQEYVKRIEENKLRIGDVKEKKNESFYDDSIWIWENDVQVVTSLIQSNVLEYTYYETKDMEVVRAKMSASLGDMILISLIVFAALVFAALFMSLVIPNSIAKPIYHINDITNQVAKGDLTARVNVIRGAEVRELGDSLNSMIEKINHLLLEVKDDQANLREAELELLQAQINPHFLYNTLDAIIWLAEAGKQSEVVKMVGALSDFFRTSLNYGNGMITLREEERHVRSYMQIQQVRYQDILEYMIDIPEELKDAIIPQITLQPLVENALYHGIKNRRSMGRITIRATSEGGDVIISVSDNGIGMTAERLEEVLGRLEQSDRGADKKRDAYGLYNVNERIKLKFGEQYRLLVTSIYGEGTCVQVRIPKS